VYDHYNSTKLPLQGFMPAAVGIYMYLMYQTSAPTMTTHTPFFGVSTEFTHCGKYAA